MRINMWPMGINNRISISKQPGLWGLFKIVGFNRVEERPKTAQGDPFAASNIIEYPAWPPGTVALLLTGPTGPSGRFRKTTLLTFPYRSPNESESRILGL